MVKFSYLDLDTIFVKEGIRKTPMDEKSLEELTSSIPYTAFYSQSWWSRLRKAATIYS